MMLALVVMTLIDGGRHDGAVVASSKCGLDSQRASVASVLLFADARLQDQLQVADAGMPAFCWEGALGEADGECPVAMQSSVHVFLTWDDRAKEFQTLGGDYRRGGTTVGVQSFGVGLILRMRCEAGGWLIYTTKSSVRREVEVFSAEDSGISVKTRRL